MEERFNPATDYIFNQPDLTYLANISAAQYNFGFGRAGNERTVIKPVQLSINQGTFTAAGYNGVFPEVSAFADTDALILSCSCSAPKKLPCEHQSMVIQTIGIQNEIRIFFDETLRFATLRKTAGDYGLEHELNLDEYFNLKYQDEKLQITPVLAGLIPINDDEIKSLKDLIVPDAGLPPSLAAELPDGMIRFAVLRQHKFYRHLLIELYEAGITKENKIKNPAKQVNTLDLLQNNLTDPETRFYTSILKFQQNIGTRRSAAGLQTLKTIASNAPGLPFYYHNQAVSDNVTAASVAPVRLHIARNPVKLKVDKQQQFYTISGTLHIDDTIYQLNALKTAFGYFIHIDGTFYLPLNINTIGIINFFKNKAETVLIHEHKFRHFKAQVLTPLEDKVKIEYAYIPPAPAHLKIASETEKLIFLSNFGSHVMILPVMRYGETEVPVRTDKEIYGEDDEGHVYRIERSKPAEIDFLSVIIRQHPYFEEQLEDDLDHFSLHKRWFLDENWFLNTFEQWQEQGITIYGFNELTRLNPNRAKVSIKVLSGINWFNVKVRIRFGKKEVSLKEIRRAVINRSKYIALDDGTQGILPADWIAKFEKYFKAGEMTDPDELQIAKANFYTIDQLFEQQMLDEPVQQELKLYKEKLTAFDAIKSVPVPAGFKGTLRPYQQQGLNWLNFLDDFNFGGCLADDMGLGKTVQIIAFILLQRSKVQHNTNLLIVPTSLIFNWQAEIARFAPSLKLLTIYGPGRIRSARDFDQYEVILTSYGTLLPDTGFLKEYSFNYIFLDESQHIKNPESQRYKAVRLLKGRNRMVITGTPFENNTFDIYAQLSFACPGLLGSKQYFKEIYSAPIDQFKVGKRTSELQDRIRPFILRRTKEQVAAELPEKTEMVLLCEMDAVQRKLYDAYEKEFRTKISAHDNEEIRNQPMHVLRGITKLRQICDSPLLLKGEKLPGESSAKIRILMEQIELKSPNHKILVFSQFVKMLDLIAAQLNERAISYSYLTGSTRNREAVVNAFQRDPGVRVFLVSLKAGGTGLNLTAADYVYLVDPWWNPAVENQAIDRAHRIGQDNRVIAVRLICPKTIEQKMMQLQESKKRLSSQLVPEDTSFFKSLNRDDLLSLLQ